MAERSLLILTGRVHTTGPIQLSTTLLQATKYHTVPYSKRYIPRISLLLSSVSPSSAISRETQDTLPSAVCHQSTSAVASPAPQSWSRPSQDILKHTTSIPSPLEVSLSMELSFHAQAERDISSIQEPRSTTSLLATQISLTMLSTRPLSMTKMKVYISSTVEPHLQLSELTLMERRSIRIHWI